MKNRGAKWGAILAVAMLGLGLCGCGESRAPYVGTYRSEQPYAGKGHIQLVLKENGESTWTLEHQTLKMKWKVEEGRIWLYTREGAILIITPSEGGKKLSVDLSGDWNPSCPVDRCLTFERVSGGG